MRNVFLVLTLVFSGIIGAKAQEKAEKPKLVVGIIVDQMRQEYLYRFSDRFVKGGFRRFMDQGFMMTNGHYNYIPTYTGPGHASVFTGTTPATHGVIANSWYHKGLGRSVYCAEDSTATHVGGTPINGKISPRNMLTTTISDEMRFATAMRSKTVGIAIKDRGASLPAGHTGDAYWYDDVNGDWMTSTFYYDSLPKWAADFNSKKRPDFYLEKTWETLFPINTYVNSIADDNEFEGIFVGKESPTFPYVLPELRAANGGYGMVASTPYGNSLTVDFAKAAIEGEKLGQRGVTDMLAVSFSSPDYIGHRFGPSSVEVEDNYLRLDRELEKFFEYLDGLLGNGQYLVFISADHAVAEVPNYLISQKAPAGIYNSSVAGGKIRGYVQEKYGTSDLILSYSNEQIFINKNLVQEKGIDFEKLQRDLADYSMTITGVKEAYIAADLKSSEFTQGRAAKLQMGYNHQASGDVLLVLESGWLAGGQRGTTHGSGYSYDTHVPVAFYGWGIKPGRSATYTSITDIAPTVAVLLGVKFPSGTTGSPIKEITN